MQQRYVGQGKKISYHNQGNREKNNTKDRAQSLKAETHDHKNKTIAKKNRHFKGASKKVCHEIVQVC